MKSNVLYMHKGGNEERKGPAAGRAGFLLAAGRFVSCRLGVSAAASFGGAAGGGFWAAAVGLARACSL